LATSLEMIVFPLPMPEENELILLNIRSIIFFLIEVRKIYIIKVVVKLNRKSKYYSLLEFPRKTGNSLYAKNRDCKCV
jgi:hypothetical protein